MVDDIDNELIKPDPQKQDKNENLIPCPLCGLLFDTPRAVGVHTITITMKIILHRILHKINILRLNQ